MRATLYSLLIGTIAITDIVPTWFDRSSVPDKPPVPYGVLGWEPELAKASGRYTNQVQVWVHDERGDYGRIDVALKAVRTLLEGTLHYSGTDGTIVQADYRGKSGDNVDPDTNTNTKYSLWEIVGREA